MRLLAFLERGPLPLSLFGLSLSSVICLAVWIFSSADPFVFGLSLSLVFSCLLDFHPWIFPLSNPCQVQTVFTTTISRLSGVLSLFGFCCMDFCS